MAFYLPPVEAFGRVGGWSGVAVVFRAWAEHGARCYIFSLQRSGGVFCAVFVRNNPAAFFGRVWFETVFAGVRWLEGVLQQARFMLSGNEDK